MTKFQYTAGQNKVQVKMELTNDLVTNPYYP